MKSRLFGAKGEMVMNTWVGTFKTPSGGLVRVEVRCANSNQARQMFDAQYGAGRVINIHQGR